MRAIRISDFSSEYDKTLSLEEVEKPTPSPGFAVVAIKAASGNPVDFKVLQGYLKDTWECPLPMTVGYDFSGIVDCLDDADIGASKFKVGDEVFAVNWGVNQHKPVEEGATVGGAFAEYIKVPLRMLSRKPSTITHKQAAAIALVGTTAHQALFDCLQVGKGSKVLILGGPTAVGSIAIQLAKDAGAWVATTASTRNLEYVSQFKPDLVVNYREEDWSKDRPELQEIDAVFDAVGEKDAFARAVTNGKVVKEGGSFVSIASPDAGVDPVAHQPRIEYGSFFA